MFTKLLVCSDGSENALMAARRAAQIAQKFQATVVLIQVVSGWELVVTLDEMDAHDQQARLALERGAGAIFKAMDVLHETLIETGHPAEAITRIAREHKVDLIVMGSWELNGVETLLLGSNSESVLHQAHCPVLMVRGESDSHETPGFARLLLASDGSTGALRANGVAVQLAEAFSAFLDVLTVVDDSSLSYGLAPYLIGEATAVSQDAARLLTDVTHEAEQEATGTSLVISFHQETGCPADTIVAFAERHDADLIVLGCRGLGPISSALLGSVSNRVAHLSRRSVLVTR